MTILSGRGAWLTFGFLAQLMFGLRFLMQWLASEKAGRSVVPTAFWHLSILGAVGLLIYAVHIKDPVIAFGQLFGVLIYGRNLALIAKGRA